MTSAHRAALLVVDAFRHFAVVHDVGNDLSARARVVSRRRRCAPPDLGERFAHRQELLELRFVLDDNDARLRVFDNVATRLALRRRTRMTIIIIITTRRQ